MQPNSHTFNGKPWPPEPPPFDNTPFIIMASVFYTVGFLIFCCMLTAGPTALRDKPWIPARVRGDACLTPLFFVWPAFFWPLVFPMMPLTMLYFFLKGVFYLILHLIGPATTCCGIPLPPWWSRILGRLGAPQAASSEADLEMGPVVADAEDGGEGEPDGGKDASDPADLRSAGSGDSERPPSYTSLVRDEDEDDSGEADGLLAKSTDKEVGTVGK